MNIIRAKTAGFCFGVERAVNEVIRQAETNPPGTVICTLGALIHNPSVMRELDSLGVRIIGEDDIDRIYAGTDDTHRSVIIIRAHGIERQTAERLAALSAANPAFRVVDCTCPNVTKIHRIADAASSGRLIIIGDASHPEVRSVRSWGGDDVFITDSAEGLLTMPATDKTVTAVSQTTQNVTEWKKSQEIIKKLCTNPIFFDTICKATEKRQSEADNISKTADLMIVIGGKNSSNTNKLCRIAEANGCPTRLIEDSSGLDGIAFLPTMTVGVTAGASTPRRIIEEVINHMSENEIKTEQEFSGEESFADMLEQSLKTLNTGETVRGIITNITANELHVDLGTKFTGIIPFDEITDDTSVKLSEMFKVGDEVEAIVGKVSDREGTAMLSKKRCDNIVKWRGTMDAFREGAVIEGKIDSAVKGGVILNWGGVRVFIPASQTTVPKNGELESLVGTTQRAKLIDIDEQRRRAVGSIRSVAREERRLREIEFWDTVEIGKHYNGTVRSLTSYAAFVDLGGVDGMVHSSELSWRRIKNPSEVVSVGQVIDVYVKDFDREAKRVSLGYKTEETNPWNIFVGSNAVGDVVPVRVVNMMPFGAFAEIIPGVDGLIHISQITDHKIAKPADVLESGQTVNAKIIEIDTEHHQVGLSIRALMEEGSDDNGSDEPDELVYSSDNPPASDDEQ